MKTLTLTVVMMMLISCSTQKELVRMEKISNAEEAYLAALSSPQPGAVEDALFILLHCDIHNCLKINRQIHEKIKFLAINGQTDKIQRRASLVMQYLNSDDKFLSTRIKLEYHNKEKIFDILDGMLKKEKLISGPVYH